MAAWLMLVSTHLLFLMGLLPLIRHITILWLLMARFIAVLTLILLAFNFMDYAYAANLPANWQALDTGIDDKPTQDGEVLEPDYIPGFDDGEEPEKDEEDLLDENII